MIENAGPSTIDSVVKIALHDLEIWPRAMSPPCTNTKATSCSAPTQPAASSKSIRALTPSTTPSMQMTSSYYLATPTTHAGPKHHKLAEHPSNHHPWRRLDISQDPNATHYYFFKHVSQTPPITFEHP